MTAAVATVTAAPVVRGQRQRATVQQPTNGARLTDAQRRTLTEWIRRVGCDFYHALALVFPALDAQDRARILLCRKLCRMGYLVCDNLLQPEWARRYRISRLIAAELVITIEGR